MEINSNEMITAVTRKVDTIDRDGEPAKAIVLTRTYPTSVEDLWDALTTEERIPRWFLPIKGELKVGGRYQLEGNAGGEVLSCEPPRRFEITWENGGFTSWVTVELSGEPDGDEAKLEMRHVAHIPDDMWDQFGPAAVGIGWDLTVLGLDLHLTTGGSADPLETSEWQASANARDFMSASSAAWADAAIGSGDDPEAARAAAARTTATYTATD